MALPISPNNISLGQINTEFGNSVTLANQIRGTNGIPTTDGTIGVPTAVPASLTDYYGATSVVFSSSSFAVSPTAVDVEATPTFSYTVTTGLSKKNDYTVSGVNTAIPYALTFNSFELGGTGRDIDFDSSSDVFNSVNVTAVEFDNVIEATSTFQAGTLTGNLLTYSCRYNWAIRAVGQVNQQHQETAVANQVGPLVYTQTNNCQNVTGATCDTFTSTWFSHPNLTGCFGPSTLPSGAIQSPRENCRTAARNIGANAATTAGVGLRRDVNASFPTGGCFNFFLSQCTPSFGELCYTCEQVTAPQNPDLCVADSTCCLDCTSGSTTRSNQNETENQAVIDGFVTVNGFVYVTGTTSTGPAPSGQGCAADKLIDSGTAP